VNSVAVGEWDESTLQTSERPLGLCASARVIDLTETIQLVVVALNADKESMSYVPAEGPFVRGWRRQFAVM
jgi:hypothetical protein